MGCALQRLTVLLVLLLLLLTGHHHADACWPLLQGHSHQRRRVGCQHCDWPQRSACQCAHAHHLKVSAAAVRDTAAP
jgi:hypothetical protein